MSNFIEGLRSQARAINWDRANQEARMATTLGLQNAPFVFDPMKYSNNQQFNTGLIYAGPSTTPRSDAFTPGKQVPLPALPALPGAGGMGGAAPAPMMQPQASGPAPAPSGAQPSGAAPAPAEAQPSGNQSMFKPAAVPSWSYEPTAMDGRYTSTKPQEDPSIKDPNAFGGFYVPRGKGQVDNKLPYDGQMAQGSMSAPDVPLGEDGKPQQGYWVAQGNANVANGGDTSAGNAIQNYRWVSTEPKPISTKSIFGLEDMIKGIFGQLYGGQQQMPSTAVMPDNTGAGMMPETPTSTIAPFDPSKSY